MSQGMVVMPIRDHNLYRVVSQTKHGNAKPTEQLLNISLAWILIILVFVNAVPKHAIQTLAAYKFVP